jgi:8-oxo-dGTP pyrophosphatase MutT (NUDIX family)
VPEASSPLGWLEGYRGNGETERADLERLGALGAVAEDLFDRTSELHVTGSALVLHPPTKRVLLRWHGRQHEWLQVGGHGDSDEFDPFSVALREATEETGLFDLAPYPHSSSPRPIHVVVVPVAESADESAHEHIDVRYLLATGTPDSARPESLLAPVHWSPLEIALELASENLAETMRRALALLST